VIAVRSRRRAGAPRPFGAGERTPQNDDASENIARIVGRKL